MSEIKLNFFPINFKTSEKAINQLSEFLSITNKSKLKTILDSYDYNKLGVEEILDLIKKFKLDLNKPHYDTILIKCKHGTTTIDDFKFMKKNGFINLNELIKCNSPFSEFLANNELKILINEKLIEYKGKRYPILDNEEYCEKCILNKIDCESIFNNNLPDYKSCEYRDDLYRLHLRLYKDEGGAEVFISETPDEVYNYSTISRYPEILYTLDDILKHLCGKRFLASDWENRTDGMFHILEFYIPIDNLLFYENRLTVSDFNSIDSILDYYGYDIYDYENGEINNVFFVNLFVIYQLVFNYYGSCRKKYGCLNTSVKIPWDEIKKC